MKTKNLLFLISFAIGAWGCSDNIRVKSDYDRDLIFSEYKTYDWLSDKDIESKNNPLIYNELTDKRIKTAVDGLMSVKGINASVSNPDLKIHYHITIEDKSIIRTDPYGVYGPYWTRNQINGYQFKEGTLIIDLMDAHTNALVWRGWAISILEGDDVDITEEKIKVAVTKILSEFPPVKK